MQLVQEWEDTNVLRLALKGEVAPVQPEDGDLEAQFGGDVFSKNIIVNMIESPFVNSAGIGWLLSCHKKTKAAGGRFVLHSVAPAVMDALKLMRVDRVLEIVDDADAAVKRVSEEAS